MFGKADLIRSKQVGRRWAVGFVSGDIAWFDESDVIGDKVVLQGHVAVAGQLFDYAIPNPESVMWIGIAEVDAP